MTHEWWARGSFDNKVQQQEIDTDQILISAKQYSSNITDI